MSVGRESIRRAANAGAGKTVKKPVVSTKEAEKPETISVTEEKKKTEKNKKSQEPSIPDGMWIKCNTCKNIIYKKEVTEFKLCPNCGAHFRMSPAERIKIICDEGSFKELDACLLYTSDAADE